MDLNGLLEAIHLSLILQKRDFTRDFGSKSTIILRHVPSSQGVPAAVTNDPSITIATNNAIATIRQSLMALK